MLIAFNHEDAKIQDMYSPYIHLRSQLQWNSISNFMQCTWSSINSPTTYLVKATKYSPWN